MTQPSILVSDASNSIRNAFFHVFGGDSLIIMCWAHVRRNISKHLNLVVSEYQNDILEDIDSFQLASNNEIFEKGKNVFIKKWLQRKQKDFVDNMKLQWFDTHQNWYEGVAARVPSTNNCLESFNLVIKKESTLRERLPLSRFFQLCLIMNENWSRAYENCDKIVIENVTLDLNMWFESYNWAKSNKIITSKESNDSIVYYCPPKDEVKVTTDDISNVLEMKWNTFDQYKKRAFSTWITTLPKEQKEWLNGN